jgi:hypothetical protein
METRETERVFNLSIDELIVYEIEGTAHWRRLKTDEYPEAFRPMDQGECPLVAKKG